MPVEGCGEEMKPVSPQKSKLKILCSHGGKILPRPADGHLKYIGGETRVIALPRNITFPELMSKFSALVDGDMVLKYQLTTEDLDALVSLRSDDDLRHMLEEYDRHENGGSPKLRAFLLPSTPTIINQMPSSTGPHVREQRYIDAINGIIRANSNAKLNSSINSNRLSFSISSACTSPETLSPKKYSVAIENNAMIQETVFPKPHPMHKVRSSPSLSSLNDQNSQNGHGNNQHIHQHHHHYYHNHYSHSQHSYISSHDPNKINSSEILALVSPRSNSRIDNVRSQMGYGSEYYFGKDYRGNGYGGTDKFGKFDDNDRYQYRRLDRADSLPPRS